MRRRPARPAGYPREWRPAPAADVPRSAAAARRRRTLCRPARWLASACSFAGNFGLADIAQRQFRDDVIPQIRGIADRIERLDIHLLADDLDADLIVGRGTGHDAGLDGESFAQQL